MYSAKGNVRFARDSDTDCVSRNVCFGPNSGHSSNNSSPCKNKRGRHSSGGSRICGFKAALPRQRLRFCAILSNVAVRSYDGALRSSMSAMLRSLYAVVIVPGKLEMNVTQRTQRKEMYHLLLSLVSAVSQLWKASAYHPERHYMRGPGPKWREKH